MTVTSEVEAVEHGEQHHPTVATSGESMRITMQHPHGWMHKVTRPDGTEVTRCFEAEDDGSEVVRYVGERTDTGTETLAGPFVVTCSTCGTLCRALAKADVRHEQRPGIWASVTLLEGDLQVKLADRADDLERLMGGLFMAATVEDFDAGVARLRAEGYAVKVYRAHPEQAAALREVQR